MFNMQDALSQQNARDMDVIDNIIRQEARNQSNSNNYPGLGEALSMEE